LPARFPTRARILDPDSGAKSAPSAAPSASPTRNGPTPERPPSASPTTWPSRCGRALSAGMLCRPHHPAFAVPPPVGLSGTDLVPPGRKAWHGPARRQDEPGNEEREASDDGKPGEIVDDPHMGADCRGECPEDRGADALGARQAPDRRYAAGGERETDAGEQSPPRVVHAGKDYAPAPRVAEGNPGRWELGKLGIFLPPAAPALAAGAHEAALRVSPSCHGPHPLSDDECGAVTSPSP